ncbi:metallophosphoesterase [Gammaproteobacteria bacterium]|nr:metallophosphoesterase [Gammaproteobacteria bacterium]
MAASRTYTVFQFTDSHLSADPAACMRGVNTTDSLKAVTALASALALPDAIVATGDLSQDGSEASYSRFREEVSQPNIPLRWLPGNHDDAMMMRRCSGAGDGEDAGTGKEPQPLRLGKWHLIMLDSQVLGAEHGALDAECLRALEVSLAKADAASEYVLLCVHHNPLRTGAKWMDTIDLTNGAELLAMLNKHPSARALIHGHIHHKFERVVGNVQVLGTPSTCAQFAPQATDFEIDTQPATCQPGFRWLRLHPDGAVETGVERVAAGTFTPSNAARTNTPYVLYLHGFLSSPQSLKAKQALTYCQQQGIEIDIPALTEGPAATIAALRERLEAGIARTGGAVLIGSSLGGYYATYLANHYELRAALINPAVRPYLLLRDYLGEQRNYHTGAVHEVTEEQMQELLDIEVETLATPENFRVMLQTGDETLDYAEAAAKYAESSLHIYQGGDHSYQGFDNELPQLFAFLLSRTATKAR